MARFGIKIKIIVTFCLIVTFSLAISGGVAYYYCFNILQTQSLKDEAIKLNRTARQIEYITDDIRNYALNIVLDRNIQNYFRGVGSNDHLGKYTNMEKIRDQLGALVVQREYILNIILIDKDNMIFSKAQSGLYLDMDYYKKRMEEPWYTDTIDDKRRSLFSSLYELPRLKVGNVKVIPYIVNVIDTSNPQKTVGQMILNINYDYLKKYMVTDGVESDNYLWLDAESGYVLYQKEPSDKKLTQEEISFLIQRSEAGKSNSFKTDHGYYIIDRTMKEDWILSSYISSGRISQKIKNIIYFFLLYTSVILLFTIIIILPIVFGITRPLSKLTRVMKSVSEGNLDVSIAVKSNDELGILAQGFNRMLSSLKDYISKTIEYEKERRKIETSLLQAQINPHFIYNTLQTVVYMASKEKNNDIVNMVRSFIAVLQDTVRINEQGIVTSLAQEIEVVRQYLNIQQYRYKGRFDTEWDIDESLLNCSVPRTILQPIVENSLLHGILPKNEKGIVKITAASAGEDILITIEDNGIGMDNESIVRVLSGSEELERHGKMRSIGIYNVIERIKHIYGEHYGISIESQKGEFTRFLIKLPRNTSLPG